MTFNTVEDVNGTQFDNQGFWWYELDTAVIDPDGTAEYENIKIDFCTITKKTDELNTWAYNYTVTVNATNFTGGFDFLSKNGESMGGVAGRDENVVTGIYVKSKAPLKILLYMGMKEISSEWGLMDYYIVNPTLDLNLKELNQSKTITIKTWGRGYAYSVSQILVKGYNEIYYNNLSCGYLLVKLLKTDFQFNCNQDLIVGEVNTVQLGTNSDYKPLGDLVGEYATKLSVLYNDKTIPVVWNSQLNDYTFDLDLTDKTDEGKVRFKVIVEANEVLNASETDVALDCKFETIDTLAKLTELFRIGGVGRLGANLTLTDDLTLTKSVNLIGNDCSIDMASHKLVIPSDLTFKAQSVNFSNGVNTVQQEPNSSVELSNCSFTGCTGFGSVIDCQVDLASLDESDDFTTRLTDCTISDCDMAILSGGNLEVNGCSVIGKISNKNYPYFLYQTDGNATILNSEFDLTDSTVYDFDIEFNSCIFTCGETATINGYSHTELQNNNLSAFFDTQRNTSTIDVKYYYSLIEDTVHLQSGKGFCHSVSGVDFVYKTNITLTRGE